MILNVREIAVILLSLGAALALGGSAAQAATCEVPLRPVLADAHDCAYYVTAFRMMTTHKISVDAVCTRGAYSSSEGAQYTAKIATTLTIRDSSCATSKPLALNPVLLSMPNCSNLERVIALLGTEFVDLRPSCKFGTWIGADGAPRTSMVATHLRLRKQVAQR